MIEVVIAMVIVGILLVGLYAGITSAFFSVQMARENLRATQILTEKMEVIRLSTWSQIMSNGILAPSFDVAYDPESTTGGGPIYHGKLWITNGPPGVAYAGDMIQVTVQLNWQTRNLARSRDLSTYVSRYGLHQYLHN